MKDNKRPGDKEWLQDFFSSLGGGGGGGAVFCRYREIGPGKSECTRVIALMASHFDGESRKTGRKRSDEFVLGSNAAGLAFSFQMSQTSRGIRPIIAVHHREIAPASARRRGEAPTVVQTEKSRSRQGGEE